MLVGANAGSTGSGILVTQARIGCIRDIFPHSMVFRYEYVTRTLSDISCVEHLNRYTKDRCLVSEDEPRCRTIVTAPPCEK